MFTSDARSRCKDPCNTDTDTRALHAIEDPSWSVLPFCYVSAWRGKWCSFAVQVSF